MNKTHSLALLTFILAGCSSASYTPDWEMPKMQVLGDNGLPAQPYMHCNKRGCHDHKPMLFDPTKAEPDATSLHRGW
ncbi:hypothetical protein H8F21_07545 [Pseudomonas sp. P66]|uniref:Lipoprotein n=1 Tax=Pseudomonas arcuscaelestis TaxID=2710591 RepID=A0ABS2BUW5_9PSED|nr:hypothetical protein [Pseudomonas arcuscaelestis]MBM3113832.1 hypothetical protein [Pseudomonas arcuscaelestis]MBM5457423.1 hypothetical protein [Pseudomonas arcuscaelestis]